MYEAGKNDREYAKGIACELMTELKESMKIAKPSDDAVFKKTLIQALEDRINKFDVYSVRYTVPE